MAQLPGATVWMLAGSLFVSYQRTVLWLHQLLSTGLAVRAARSRSPLTPWGICCLQECSKRGALLQMAISDYMQHIPGHENSPGPVRQLYLVCHHMQIASSDQATIACHKSHNLRIAHITLSTNEDALASADLTTCSNLPPRSESIPALLPDQLDYIDLLISDESTQPTPRQHVPSKSASSISMFHKELQELEPCNPEWNPPHSSGALFASLEDEMLSTDDSPMHR